MNPRSLLIAIFIVSGFSLPLRADDQAVAMEFGKTKYASCVACHGRDGNGIETSPGRLIASNFSKSEIVRGDAEWMALIVMKGLKKEDARYLGVKTAMETNLDDKELAAILTYVRNTWGGRNGRVTEEQVAGWREKYAEIKQPLRRADIEKHVKEAAR